MDSITLDSCLLLHNKSKKVFNLHLMFGTDNSSSRKPIKQFIYHFERTLLPFRNQAEAYWIQGEKIQELIISEAPNYKKYFNRIVEIYQELSYVYLNGCNAIGRAIEDLKDIPRRYTVYRRIRRERRIARKEYFSICEQFDKEKENKSQNIGVIELKKTELGKVLLEKDILYSSYRLKYKSFYLRRLKSGFQRYGDAITNIHIQESGFLNELSILFKSIKDHATEMDRILIPCKVEHVVLEKVPSPDAESFSQSQASDSDDASSSGDE